MIIAGVPWSIILMVCGVSVLVGVIEKTGGMDLFTTLLARITTPGTANGMMAFGLYGFAFIGNWIEQIGTFADNVTARNVGTLSSLVLPTESLWNLACYQMQPSIMRELSFTPFSPVSVPSGAMIWWAVGYVLVALFLGLRAFRHRPL